MPTCPNGHQSGSDDWCEVCGHRMAGAVPPPPPPPPPGGYGFPPPQGTQAGGGRPPASSAPEPELCPQCRTPREGGAPFCEECRWNFLTNTATSYTPAAPRPPQPRFQPPSATYGGNDGYEYQGSRPSQMNRPAEPIPSFGSEPSGPTPFGDPDRRPSGPPTSPGPSGFGGGPGQGPGQGSGGPSGFGQGSGGPGGPGGPSGFGGRPGQSQGQGPGGPGGPGGPSGFSGGPGQGANGPGGPGGPSGFGGPGQGQGQGQGQGPGGPSGPPPFGREPSGPGGSFGRDGSGPGGPGGPSGFGGDPSRPVPPPPGAGPGGAPQAFQQSGPPAPPAFPRESGRPAGGPPSGGPSFGGEDDWVISPPSSGGPGGGQGGGPGGGYGYPQPGATQAPPGPGGFPQQRATWTATIGPDREYFMAMMQRSGPEAAGLNLPAYSPEQQRTLSGNQVTIGRRRHSTGDTPDIDLSVPPEDPGVSHQHAVLVQQPDGSWAVVDQNSTNGTTVNMSDEPIQPFVPVPLQDGDRVHVGAWTTITIRRG
ncbi:MULTISPECIES: FHA domain-containing protein [unclassified Streptomyces]|uniref:FHA domain-containing protein n=1 Tax=unclassified Streptomyces TaxID=2593676 RepID=UPI0040415EB9